MELSLSAKRQNCLRESGVNQPSPSLMEHTGATAEPEVQGALSTSNKEVVRVRLGMRVTGEGVWSGEGPGRRKETMHKFLTTH